MELLQLSYRSVRSEWTHDAEVIEGIVLPALRRNRQHDITGCLWFGPTTFYQALEGRPECVDRLFAVIARDPRHHSVRCIGRRAVEARQFDRFAMRVVRSHDELRMIRLLDLLEPRPPRADDASGADRPELCVLHRQLMESAV